MFKDTRYFTVFGGCYVPERHNDRYRFDVDPKAWAREPRAAASWVVLCTLIVGISVFAAEIAYLTTGTHRLFQ